MEIFIANWFLQVELEAEMDDHDWDLEREASPQFGDISLQCSEEWITKLQNEILDELQEEVDSYDELSKFDRDQYFWTTIGWRYPEPPSRHNQVWKLWHKTTKDELEAVLVIQQVLI